MGESFYIIDGHAQIYRAYFAPFRELSSASGEPTKATFVFTQMLLNLIEQRRPSYLAMVIDAGDETVFRKQILPEYKANRQQRPDDFLPQEQRILRIVRDAGIPIFVKPGFEADDLIATMARRLCDRGFDLYLVSKDKDLRQIVNDCTRMYDVQSNEIMDAAAIEKKHGYRPAQAVDVQTLMGDSIDNVPGIPGVGEKTAAKLINQYGSVEAILEHLDELTPKLRENFAAHRNRLPVARQLVTLRTDVEFDFDPQTCRFQGLNVAAIRPHLQELGFTSLVTRLDDSKVEPRPRPQRVVRPAAQVQGGLFADDAAPAVAVPELATSADCIYTLVNTDEQFQAMLAELRQQRRFCFDTETTSLGAVSADLVGLSLSWKPQTGWYVPVKGPAGCTHLDCERVLESLKPIFEDPSIRKVGHNLKYDTLVLRQHGIDVCGLSMDSMVAAFLLDSGRLRYGIDDLARDLLRFGKIPTEALIGRGRSQITMDRVELEKIACYAAEDADIALRLCDLLEARLDEVPTLRRLADEVEIPLIPVLAEMEHNGIAIDPAVLAEQSRAMGERVDQLRAQIQEQAGREFNPDSPRQLAEVLFERLRLKVIKRTKTGPSTDVEVLERLAAEHPVPRLVLEYRSLIKLKNTYLDNLTQYQDPRTGRIHTSFNQTGAATGRLSSSDPNLQNIPIRTDEGRRIRLAFVPGERQRNVLLTADYSQIELRVLAHFTQEPALLEAFERDQDIHRAVAAEVFGVPLDSVTRDQRGQAKVINFGIIYGVSAYGLARRIEGLSLDAAGDLIRAYNRRFPAIRRFLESCVMDAQAHGYVQTILGRRRAIPDINSAVLSVRNGAERMAINSVVQGSAADLIKVAMVHLHERLRSQARPSRMLLQVHDELVLETPEDQVQADADIVREEMIAAGRRLGLSVPLKVEVGWGKNWQEVK